MGNTSTLSTRSSELNSMSLVFMPEFLFDGFDGGPQPSRLIWVEVLRRGLGINVEENDCLVPREIKIDDPRAAGPTPARQSHPHLAQALQTRDNVARLRVFQQVVLKLGVLGYLGPNLFSTSVLPH
jgi:hypothetical protein